MVHGETGSECFVAPAHTGCPELFTDNPLQVFIVSHFVSQN